MDQRPPLPPRVAWFAPWTWRRRRLVAAAIPLLLVGYAASIGPALLLIDQNGRRAKSVAVVYYPLLHFSKDWLSRESGPLHQYLERWSPRGHQYLKEATWQFDGDLPGSWRRVTTYW
jgi:hypothetical protein